MEPCLQDEQQLIINKFVYHFQEPERGDVIIFHPPPPYNPKTTPFIKRIIALPGDTVEIENGNVYINDTELNEPYIKEPPTYNLLEQEIPENEYFVLGDNRNNASDSHTGWTVPRQNIIGKAWLSIWPPSQWGLVLDYPLNEQLASSGSE
jgi:signal peptidase I